MGTNFDKPVSKIGLGRLIHVQFAQTLLNLLDCPASSRGLCVCSFASSHQKEPCQRHKAKREKAINSGVVMTKWDGMVGLTVCDQMEEMMLLPGHTERERERKWP